MRPRISIRGRVRPSVRPSVGPSVRPSLHPSVPPSLHPSDHCNIYNFKDNYSTDFHRVADEKGVTLLGAIVTLKMVKEQEEVIEILRTIDQYIFPDKREDSEFRITEELKKAIPTSVGLKESITSLGTRYPWSPTKKKVMLAFCLSSMLSTLLFYGGDVGTDLKFTVNMADNRIAKDSNVKNITCRTTFRVQFDNATNICNDSFKMNAKRNCRKVWTYSRVKTAQKTARDSAKDMSGSYYSR